MGVKESREYMSKCPNRTGLFKCKDCYYGQKQLDRNNTTLCNKDKILER